MTNVGKIALEQAGSGGIGDEIRTKIEQLLLAKVSKEEIEAQEDSVNKEIEKRIQDIVKNIVGKYKKELKYFSVKAVEAKEETSLATIQKESKILKGIKNAFSKVINKLSPLKETNVAESKEDQIEELLKLVAKVAFFTLGHFASKDMPLLVVAELLGLTYEVVKYLANNVEKIKEAVNPRSTELEFAR